MASETKDVDTLMRENERLVKRIAHYMQSRLPGEMLDELTQAGMIGLWKAAKKWQIAGDTGRALFQTYATRRIQGEMLDLLRSEHEVMPRSSRRETNRIARTRAKLQHELGHEPRAQEIADCMGIALEEYHLAVLDEFVHTKHNLEGFASGYSDTGTASERNDAADQFVYDDTTPLDYLIAEEHLRHAVEAMDELTQDERSALRMTVEEEARLTEIGVRLGFSESRACQVLTRARQKIARRLDTSGVTGLKSLSRNIY